MCSAISRNANTVDAQVAPAAATGRPAGPRTSRPGRVSAVRPYFHRGDCSTIETPYAEGRGDSSTLAFGSDNSRHLTDICSRVTTCIAILYSGRPVIIGDQLPKADAFTAAWLPGTEAAGITDVLFGAGFTGTLPVTWPSAVTSEPINTGDGKVPLFPLGFGLTPY